MKHTFRFVWRRNWGDDYELFDLTGLSLTKAMIAQLKREVDDNPDYKDRLRFSEVVTMQDNYYFILCEVDVDYPANLDTIEGFEHDAWMWFVKDFQKTFDVEGAAGEYRSLEAAAKEKIPVPPWAYRRFFIINPNKRRPPDWKTFWEIASTYAEGNLNDIYRRLGNYNIVLHFDTEDDAKRYCKITYGIEDVPVL